MFSVGGSELLLICFVSCLLIDPKKLPVVLRDIKLFYRKFTLMKDNFRRIMSDTFDLEDSANGSNEEKQMKIVGNDGILYKAHTLNDISDITKSDNEVKDDSDGTGRR